MPRRDLKRFRGFNLPTTTPIPDQLFDDLLAGLSGAELKVLLYICRRTFGFKKQFDNISLQQMVHGLVTRNGKVLDRGTGLSKPSVVRAAKALVEKGIIVRNRRRSARKGDQPTTYSLHITPVSQNLTPPGTKMRHGGVAKLNPQETVEQQTVDNKTVNRSQAPAEHHPVRDLQDITQPSDKAQYVALDIADQLRDRGSINFYRLVAAKVPEHVIRRVLAEIKLDGANDPPRLFNYRMKRYALAQQHADQRQQMNRRKMSIGAIREST